MNETQRKALLLLGLARKARKLEIGEEPCGIACRSGKAKLLLIAHDCGRPHIPPRKILLPGGKAPVPVRAVHEGRAGGRTGLQRLRAVRNSGRAVCKGVSGGPAGAGAAA